MVGSSQVIPVPLVFNAPRRGLPPQHLADLDEAGRKSAVQELGLPAFRADQIARHYYGRLVADPEQMTDLPAAVREKVAESLFPTLLTTVRDISCDAGTTKNPGGQNQPMCHPSSRYSHDC